MGANDGEGSFLLSCKQPHIYQKLNRLPGKSFRGSMRNVLLAGALFLPLPVVYLLDQKQRMMDGEGENLFRNRQDAGEQLARFLEPRYGDSDAIVVGIPRGGVEVAYYVAVQLNLPLSMIIAKKLPYPDQQEVGFGAVAEDHSVYVNQKARASLRPETIQHIIEKQTDEVMRRVQHYRQGKPLPDMKGRKVLVVDDGIATGVTLIPVVRLCRHKEAKQVIVAAPVSGKSFDRHLREEADAVEILVQPQPFFGVGQVYESFGDFTDQELLALLETENRRASGSPNKNP
jgi:putative phosphoribosyl transferase